MNQSAIPTPELGLCQWFHYQDRTSVERCIALMDELGVRHLRTGVSWADYHRPGGRAWYRWQMKALARFDVLLSVWHTPPSLSQTGRCSGPPRRLQDYADFIDELIQQFGDCFNDLELWNEPNNRLKWDFPHCDPDWSQFARMIAMAGHWAQQCGKRTVLGGMIPVDPHWLRLIARHGAMPYLDIIAIHGFPEMWWDHAPNWEWYRHWRGWGQKVKAVQPHAGHRPIWITETGLATCDLSDGRASRFDLQGAMLEQAARAPVERVYWYTLLDLAPERDAIEGFHVDENEYHLGLVTADGRKKPAFHRFAQLLADRAETGTMAPDPLQTPNA